ncbi:hypothetical protein FGO68_gene3128 [Halteria grandinella]|uniref:Uncharacterized protein n=1 Tax=Halteria grandinella TaxID=5974 RepID=A0A8J8NH17_HALGN|nr:hypothetical protein FGO68_gene3128 [Halteria grandinella]
MQDSPVRNFAGPRTQQEHNFHGINRFAFRDDILGEQNLINEHATNPQFLSNPYQNYRYSSNQRLKQSLEDLQYLRMSEDLPLMKNYLTSDKLKQDRIQGLGRPFLQPNTNTQQGKNTFLKTRLNYLTTTSQNNDHTSDVIRQALASSQHHLRSIPPTPMNQLRPITQLSTDSRDSSHLSSEQLQRSGLEILRSSASLSPQKRVPHEVVPHLIADNPIARNDPNLQQQDTLKSLITIQQLDEEIQEAEELQNVLLQQPVALKDGEKKNELRKLIQMAIDQKKLERNKRQQEQMRMWLLKQIGNYQQNQAIIKQQEVQRIEEQKAQERAQKAANAAQTFASSQSQFIKQITSMNLPVSVNEMNRAITMQRKGTVLNSTRFGAASQIGGRFQNNQILVTGLHSQSTMNIGGAPQNQLARKLKFDQILSKYKNQPAQQPLPRQSILNMNGQRTSQIIPISTRRNAFLQQNYQFTRNTPPLGSQTQALPTPLSKPQVISPIVQSALNQNASAFDFQSIMNQLDNNNQMGQQVPQQNLLLEIRDLLKQLNSQQQSNSSYSESSNKKHKNRKIQADYERTMIKLQTRMMKKQLKEGTSPIESINNLSQISPGVFTSKASMRPSVPKILIPKVIFKDANKNEIMMTTEDPSIEMKKHHSKHHKRASRAKKSTEPILGGAGDEILLDDKSSSIDQQRKSSSYSKQMMRRQSGEKKGEPNDSKQNSMRLSSTVETNYGTAYEMASSGGISFNTTLKPLSQQPETMLIFKKAKLVEDHQGQLQVKSGTEEQIQQELFLDSQKKHHSPRASRMMGGSSLQISQQISPAPRPSVMVPNKKPHVKHVLANNVIGLFSNGRRQSIVEKPMTNNLLEIAQKKAKAPHGKKSYNDYANTNLSQAQQHAQVQLFQTQIVQPNLQSSLALPPQHPSTLHQSLQKNNQPPINLQNIEEESKDASSKGSARLGVGNQHSNHPSARNSHRSNQERHPSHNATASHSKKTTSSFNFQGVSTNMNNPFSNMPSYEDIINKRNDKVARYINIEGDGEVNSSMGQQSSQKQNNIKVNNKHAVEKLTNHLTRSNSRKQSNRSKRDAQSTERSKSNGQVQKQQTIFGKRDVKNVFEENSLGYEGFTQANQLVRQSLTISKEDARRVSNSPQPKKQFIIGLSTDEIKSGRNRDPIFKSENNSPKTSKDGSGNRSDSIGRGNSGKTKSQFHRIKEQERQSVKLVAESIKSTSQQAEKAKKAQQRRPSFRDKIIKQDAVHIKEPGRLDSLDKDLIEISEFSHLKQQQNDHAGSSDLDRKISSNHSIAKKH